MCSRRFSVERSQDGRTTVNVASSGMVSIGAMTECSRRGKTDGYKKNYLDTCRDSRLEVWVMDVKYFCMRILIGKDVKSILELLLAFTISYFRDIRSNNPEQKQ